MLKSVTHQALRILLWQAGWVVLAGGLTAVTVGTRAAWSIMAGAAIGLLATSYLVFVLIKQTLQIGKPPSMVSVFAAWLVKTILVIGLLLIALRSRAIMPLLLIVGLCGSLVAYWLSMVVGRVKYANVNDGK